MILSNLWMTLQKIEAAGHGDYIVNFAGDLCFTERNLAVIEENLFNTRAVGIKMGAQFGDTVSVFCSKIEAFVKLHPSAADLYVMTVNETKRNSIIYISVSEKKVSLTSFDDIDSDKYIESLIKAPYTVLSYYFLSVVGICIFIKYCVDSIFKHNISLCIYFSRYFYCYTALYKVKHSFVSLQ